MLAFCGIRCLVRFSNLLSRNVSLVVVAVVVFFVDFEKRKFNVCSLKQAFVYYLLSSNIFSKKDIGF